MSLLIKHTKSLVVIALPLMAAFLAQRGMQSIDTLMMGWLRPTALAAGAIGTTIFVTVLLFCMGVLSAIGIFIVRAKGLGKLEEIEPILQQGFYLTLLLSLPCIVIIYFSPTVLLAIGQDKAVVKDTALLLHGLIWGFPGFLLFLVLREFVSAFSLTTIVMITTFFSLPLTFVANYVLIYGKYHFPQSGISGIGYGGSFVMWFMFLSLLIYSKQHPKLKRYLTLFPFKLDWQRFKDILFLGTPSGMLFLLEAGMFLSTVLLMGRFGVIALAAHQVALQCVNIAYTVPVAISMAAALKIGHAAAEKNYREVQQIAFISLSIILLVAIFFVFIFIHYTNGLAFIFLDKSKGNIDAVIGLTESFIKIAAFFLCFDALQSVASGALRGLRDTFVPMLLSLGCYWLVGVGGAYYLCMFTRLNAQGIWYGLTLGLSSTAILLTWRFFKKLYVF